MEDIVRKSVLVVNLAGYVEDCGIAVASMRRSAFPKLRYLSFNIAGDGKRCAFGKARIANFLTDLWMNKQLIFEGVTYQELPPSLTSEELNAIPGGTVANGKLEDLKLISTARTGSQVTIKDIVWPPARAYLLPSSERTSTRFFTNRHLQCAVD
jgi:hypothetical protein